MKPNPIQRQPDWFDDVHDTVLILENREYEENGVSPRSEFLY